MAFNYTPLSDIYTKAAQTAAQLQNIHMNQAKMEAEQRAVDNENQIKSIFQTTEGDMDAKLDAIATSGLLSPAQVITLQGHRETVKESKRKAEEMEKIRAEEAKVKTDKEAREAEAMKLSREAALKAATAGRPLLTAAGPLQSTADAQAEWDAMPENIRAKAFAGIDPKEYLKGVMDIQKEQAKAPRPEQTASNERKTKWIAQYETGGIPRSPENDVIYNQYKQQLAVAAGWGPTTEQRTGAAIGDPGYAQKAAEVTLAGKKYRVIQTYNPQTNSYDTSLLDITSVGGAAQPPQTTVVAPSKPPDKMPGGAVEAIGALDNVQSQLDDIEKFVKDNPSATKATGPGEMIRGPLDEYGITFDATRVQLRQKLKQLVDIVYAMSGKQINEQEFKLWQKRLPTMETPEPAFSLKMAEANRYLRQLLAAKKKAFESAGYRPAKEEGKNFKSLWGD